MNIYDSFTSRCKEIAPGLKYYFPPLAGALFFRCVSQKILMLPAETVVEYAVKTCDLATWGMTALAVLLVFKKMTQEEKKPQPLDSRKVSLKQEIHHLNEEINYLRNQLKKAEPTIQ